MLAALCLAMVFAICLTSFVALSYTSLVMSTRNVMSSHAIELAEAGIENALYSENNGDWTSNSWSSISGGTGKQVTLTGFNFENGTTGSVTVTVSNFASSSPTFYSEATLNIMNQRTVKREIQATGVYLPTFTNAMGTTPGGGGASSGVIKFSGGGTIDSYDSSKGAYDAMVGSPAAANKGYSAVLLSQLASGSPGVQLGSNTIVDGYVVGTAATPESYASGSEVKGPTTPGGTAVDTSRILSETAPIQQNLPENFPSSYNIISPAAATLSGNSTLVLGNPAASVATPYIILGNLSISGNAQVSIQGPVILIVEGSVNIASGSNASIAIASTSPTTGGGPLVSLEMHAFGNLNIDGGGISNVTQNPERLLVTSEWNSAGTLEMGTTTPFYGAINFPNNSITFNNNTTIYGSVVANSITFKNSPSFHYDVNMQNSAPLSSSFMGPLFNAFKSGTASIQPMTVSNVVEIAAQ
jgi:hypothetical protein